MLSWSIFLLIIALVAALLGFSSIAGAAAGIAKILFGVFPGPVRDFALLGTASHMRPVHVRVALVVL